MKARASICDLTPNAPAELFGRAGNHDHYSALGGALEANIVLLPTQVGIVALVALDTLFASGMLREAITDRLASTRRSPLPDLWLVASHTHSAPSLDPSKPLLGAMSQVYFEEAVGQITDGILSALDAETSDIRLYGARGRCDGGVYRRLTTCSISHRPPFVHYGPTMSPNHRVDINREMTVWAGVSSDETPVFAIWSWPCHPVSHHGRHEISPDFPGKVREAIRAHFADDALPVLYFPGFCGDIRPDFGPPRPGLVDRIRRPFAAMFADPSLAESDAFTRRTGETAIQLFKQMEPLASGDHLDAACSSIPLTDLIEASTSKVVPIHVLSIGSLRLILIGAEVCGGYYELLRHLDSGYSVLSGYLNDVFGYFPTDAQIAEGGYESEGFFRPFALEGPFKTHIQDALVSAVSDMGLSSVITTRGEE